LWNGCYKDLVHSKARGEMDLLMKSDYEERGKPYSCL
jgi:hypothetical protein